MKNTLKVAFCGVISALGVAMMFFSSVIPFTQYAIPMLAGVVIISAVIELGRSWGWLVYAAISLVAFFIVPDKEAVSMFVLFFGYYPILKSYLESIKYPWLEWLLKYTIFNISMIGIFLVGLHIIGITPSEYTIGGIYLPWLFLLAGNAVFFIYDLLISRSVVLYIAKLHPYCKKLLKMG